MSATRKHIVGWRNIPISLKIPLCRSKRETACFQHPFLWPIMNSSRKRRILTPPNPTRLLTTRMRTAAALGLTAFVFTLAIRGILHLGHAQSGSLLPIDFLLHGWALVAANVALYLYLCWLGFWFIRGTAGLERFFMVGWFAGILSGPIESLRPQWAGAIRQVGIFGLGVALLAALALLLKPAGVSCPADRTDSTQM